MTCDMWHIEGGEHSLNISVPLLLWFGSDGVFQDFYEKDDSHYWIIDISVCRTAVATLNLFIISELSSFHVLFLVTPWNSQALSFDLVRRGVGTSAESATTMNFS